MNTEDATWRDIGAAVGTLIGGFLISSQYVDAVLGIGVFALFAILFIYFRVSRRALKLFYAWR